MVGWLTGLSPSVTEMAKAATLSSKTISTFEPAHAVIMPSVIATPSTRTSLTYRPLLSPKIGTRVGRQGMSLNAKLPSSSRRVTPSARLGTRSPISRDFGRRSPDDMITRPSTSPFGTMVSGTVTFRSATVTDTVPDLASSLS